MLRGFLACVLALCFGVAIVAVPSACSTGRIASPDAPPLYDAPPPPPPPSYDANVPHFCDLPGSYRFDGMQKTLVPGAKGLPDLGWVSVPPGFCVHYFGSVPNARSLRFAPGGELFVTSPTRGTTGGGPGGRSAVLVLPDDNRDGLADSTNPFVAGVSAVQGILFANDSFYFQNDTHIMKVPYEPGERTMSKKAQLVADLSSRYQSGVHWPKTLDISKSGTIYVANGSDQDEPCELSRPFRGGILAIDGTNPLEGTPIAKGFRNPIFVRCQRDHDNCFTSELTLDYSWMQAGREKIVPIRANDDWGYPCCATRDTPFTGVSPSPNCSGVADERVSFYVADTPFGFDFEPGRWPAPWKSRMYVALHGQFATWIGAKILSIDIDPTTGMPIPGGTFGPNGGQMNTGSARDFANGWDNRKLDHGRPSDITFSSDGRMFVTQDVGPDGAASIGMVLWFAPLGLPKP